MCESACVRVCVHARVDDRDFVGIADTELPFRDVASSVCCVVRSWPGLSGLLIRVDST